MNTKYDELSNLIEKFRQATNIVDLENLADELGNIGDKRAIEPLLYRLGEDKVQADPDLEDAFCDALVKLGIMKRIGNLNFRFLPLSSLSKESKELITKHRIVIPLKYFE